MNHRVTPTDVAFGWLVGFLTGAAWAVVMGYWPT